MTVRMGRLLAAVVLLTLPGIVAPAHAQSAEQKKLEYLVGKWKHDVTIPASAASPGGTSSGTESCEWFARQHVVCRVELAGAGATYTSMRTISWVPTLKQYSSYTVDSLGYAVLALGTIQGSTWTFTTDLGAAKTRSTIKTSGDSYTNTSEYAGADGKWLVTATDKAARVK